MPSKPSIPKTCLRCHQDFLAMAGDIRRGWGKYCSRRCSSSVTGSRNGAKGRIKNNDWRGARNPKYVDGKWNSRKVEYKNRYQSGHPLAAKAHRLIAEAIRTGRLTRLPCSSCGASADIHAHHHDYAKPLDVTWLCGRCHRIHHGASS